MEQGELQVPQYATNLGFGIRFLYLVIGFAALSALMLLPSRRVHNMYIHIPDKSLIIESGRLFGTKPTYYIFDGKVRQFFISGFKTLLRRMSVYDIFFKKQK